MKNIGVRVGRVTPAPNLALKDLKYTLPTLRCGQPASPALKGEGEGEFGRARLGRKSQKKKNGSHSSFTRESSWGRARENHHFTREDTKSADQRRTFQDGGIESVFQFEKNRFLPSSVCFHKTVLFQVDITDPKCQNRLDISDRKSVKKNGNTNTLRIMFWEIPSGNIPEKASFSWNLSKRLVDNANCLAMHC